jgi:hypothetical protein
VPQTEGRRDDSLRETVDELARDYLVRNAQAGHLLEAFFVAAVAAVLGIRFFLELTGYPQLGGAGLHIAHMLWGGLLMLVAVILLLGFLSAPLTRLAAVIGGFGFGAFIDELGKFITSDNDYFFRPSVALIYAVFVGLFLVFRTFNLSRPLTRQEYLVNALELIKDLAHEDLDEDEKRRVDDYLAQGDPADPLVVSLRALLAEIKPIPLPRPSIVGRARRRLRHFYGRLIDWRWFRLGLVAFFALYSIVTISVNLAYAVIAPALAGSIGGITLSFVELAVLASSLVVAGLNVVGIVRLGWSRLGAYQTFRLGILVSIFFTQFFSFYAEQLAALLGLALNVLTLEAIRYLIREEANKTLT